MFYDTLLPLRGSKNLALRHKFAPPQRPRQLIIVYRLAVSEGKINIDDDFYNQLNNMLSTSILTFCLLSFATADDVVNLINPYWARPVRNGGGSIAGSYAASVVGAVCTRACPTILLSNETYRMQQRPLMLWAASPTRRLLTLFLCLSRPVQTLMFAQRTKSHR
jgi:hypothetical protein